MIKPEDYAVYNNYNKDFIEVTKKAVEKLAIEHLNAPASKKPTEQKPTSKQIKLVKEQLSANFKREFE